MHALVFAASAFKPSFANLHDEKIDVIEWNADPAVFISKAISPARVVGVYLNDDQLSGKTATVVVPEDQLSLAIGRDGQNARLAAKLTSWRIDIKSISEAAADVLYRLQNNPDLADMAEQEQPNYAIIEGLLARKAEGSPLNPEDYEKLSTFIDRVERFASNYGKKWKKFQSAKSRMTKSACVRNYLRNCSPCGYWLPIWTAVWLNFWTKPGSTLLVIFPLP